jgi:hypothetical protein
MSDYPSLETPHIEISQKPSSGRPAKDSFKTIIDLCRSFSCLTFSPSEQGRFEYYSEEAKQWLYVDLDKETTKHTGMLNPSLIRTMETVCKENRTDPNMVLYKVIESKDFDPRLREFRDITPKSNQLHFTDCVVTVDPKTGQETDLPHEINEPVRGPSISMSYDEVISAPDSPKLMAVLDKQFSNSEEREYVQRWVGTWLAPHMPCRQQFMPLGQTRCGKSSFVMALGTSVMGTKGVSTETDYALANNHFKPANLKGKIINISNDSDPSPRIASFVKGYCGGTVSIDIKGQQSFSQRSTAKLVSPQNSFKHEDYSGAYEGRVVPFFFDQQYTNETSYNRDDPMNWDFWKPERAGILKWMLEGFVKYVRYGAPVLPKSWKSRVAEELFGGNIHSEWVRENIIKTDNPEDYLTYKAIEARLIAEVTRPIDQTALGLLLKSMFNAPRRPAMHGGVTSTDYKFLKFKD